MSKRYIKNPHIIHMVEDAEYKTGLPSDPDIRYLCIKAVFPTPEKSTTDPLKVTCKNCLRAIEKRERTREKKVEWWHTKPIPELIECPNMINHACPKGCDKC